MTKLEEVFTIAEIGQAHEGSLGIAHSYINALSDSGVNAIKFQVHLADAESSAAEPFRVKFSVEDQTRYDYWKRMEFTPGQWLGLKRHCDTAGVEFLASPFSNAAVDLLESIGVKRYKIGSGEASNFLLLQKVAETGKDILISTGLIAMDELRASLEFLKPFGCNISLLQCTTAYPTQPEAWGLNGIAALRDEFNLPVGYSDHSGTISAGLAAAALGAEILEFHVVFDRRMFGPDSKASLTVDEVRQLVKGVRDIRTSLNRAAEKNPDNELKAMFGKSLSVNKDMTEGQVVTFADLDSKKPAGLGIPAHAFKNVIGKKLKRALRANSFLTENDIQ